MTSRFYFPLAASLLVTALPVLAVPTGHLGYLRAATAIVSDARTGRETALPRGQKVGMLRLSPTGEALYFVARPGQKPKNDYNPVLSDGLLAKTPYRATRQLPGLTGVFPENARWNRRGDTIYVAGQGLSGAYKPATRRFFSTKQLPVETSRDGRVLVFTDDTSIRVKNTVTGQERVVFSIKKPQVLFDAINRAKNPAGIKDLKGEIDRELWKETNNWEFTSCALAPDGKRLYFACNAGTSMGAAGNTTWALFACDLAAGSIDVLSKVGTFFSRSPDVMTVSPDNTRLLLESSAHSSAVDNPSTVFVVDLLTQRSRELLLRHAPKGTDTNWGGGAVWSPDSQYVAFSALYYSTKKMLEKPERDWNIDSKGWRLFITDAATGKVVRVVNGATAPSWGR